MKNKKIITVTIALVAVLMLAVSCTCQDNNYDKNDHAANVQRCLQSLEDGTAYEIDEALTAKAPWKVGEIVAKFHHPENGQVVRKFLGVTKAGYYLVEDYDSYNGSEAIITKPFALMSLCAVTDEKTSSISFRGNMPSACGTFSESYAGWGKKEQGVLLDGVRHGEWITYKIDGVRTKDNYEDGVHNGLSLGYTGLLLSHFTWYDNGRKIFSLLFNDYEEVRYKYISDQEPSGTFVEFNEDDKTVQYGYWNNGEKAGTWRKWNNQGELLEEIDYN